MAVAAKSAKGKLTADEAWLEKTFKVKVADFDQAFQEGGKARKQFLQRAATLKEVYASADDMETKLAKWKKFKEPAERLKMLQASIKKAEGCVKKADLGAAIQILQLPFGKGREAVKLSDQFDISQWAGGSSR